MLVYGKTFIGEPASSTATIQEVSPAALSLGDITINTSSKKGYIVASWDITETHC